MCQQGVLAGELADRRHHIILRTLHFGTPSCSPGRPATRFLELPVTQLVAVEKRRLSWLKDLAISSSRSQRHAPAMLVISSAVKVPNLAARPGNPRKAALPP